MPIVGGKRAVILQLFWSLFIALSFFTFVCVGIVVVYVAICYAEKDDIPAFYTVEVQPDAVPGGILQITVGNIIRKKLCPYQRNVSITSADGRRYSYDAVAAYPPANVGKNPDIILPLKLDPNIAIGKATMQLVVEYRCPGNIVQQLGNSPATATFIRQFVVKASHEVDK